MAKKSYDYYKRFIDAIEISNIMADMVAGIIRKYSPDYVKNDFEADLDKLHKLEHQGDIINEEILHELNIAFITPIEREDILHVADAIDSITDCIEEIAYRLWMFNIQTLRSNIKDFTDLLLQCCSKTKELLNEFSDFKKSKSIISIMQELDELEYKGDHLYRNAIKELFTSENESIELFKWREIIHDFENAYDTCKDLGKAVESTIVKNS